MANDCMHVDTLSKQSPVNSEKYTAMFCYRNLKIDFKIAKKKKNQFSSILATPF